VHAHVPSASATHGDTLQQRAALARHAGPSLRVAGDVAGQPGLISHELLPADVARVGIAPAHRPLLDDDLDRRTLGLAGAAAHRVLAALAIGVRAGVGRVVQDAQHPAAVGRHPDQRVRGRPADRTHR
jgi:hypothetical protein